MRLFENGTFRYHVNNEIFKSSSTATMYVRKDNQEINGPYFWKLPIKNIVSRLVSKNFVQESIDVSI